MISEFEEKARGGESEELASKIQQTASEWQETAQEWQKRAAESARRAWDTTDQYVRENPWAILGAAALAGLALGLLLSRNRD
jgi:ElaB/YqjD/DUF883 family membrane-anchored ribosome-binding protein